MDPYNIDSRETYVEDLISPEVKADRASFLPKVFGWMFLGLLVTAAIAAYFAASQDMVSYFEAHRGVLIGAIIFEILLVVIISFKLDSLNPKTAFFLFLLYAGVNGFVMSYIASIYTSGSIASTFAVTAGMFGAMGLYGWVTKRDLSGLGSIFLMALIGLIIGTVLNLIWFNETIYWILTAAGILIFGGLTAFDMQRIKNVEAHALTAEDRDRAAISGALSLYLDFINMFLFLLRIFGR